MVCLALKKIQFIPFLRIVFAAIPKTYGSFNNSKIAWLTSWDKILDTVCCFTKGSIV
jgi:hypothetical protein